MSIVKRIIEQQKEIMSANYETLSIDDLRKEIVILESMKNQAEITFITSSLLLDHAKDILKDKYLE